MDEIVSAIQIIGQYRILHIPIFSIALMIVGLALIYVGLKKDDAKVDKLAEKSKRNWRFFKFGCFVAILVVLAGVLSDFDFASYRVGDNKAWDYVYFISAPVILIGAICDWILIYRALSKYKDKVGEGNPLGYILINKLGLKTGSGVMAILVFAYIGWCIYVQCPLLMLVITVVYMWVCISNLVTLRKLHKKV